MIENLLKEKNFKEEKVDTGIRYTLESGNIELICYVEPNVEVNFISLYKWKNNDVKGTYNLTIQELRLTKDTLQTMFRKTKNNMPEHVGETVNVHQELDKVIDEIR
ncbi:hypothetical protein [Prevotella sp. 10(H)]|uniref:hypothetical protein n=1 Tax=Prevotella sp. 10(H) TaxID=1158294 RepID=UPI000ABDA108|nr:hypothetical protein [Prevotella sp. 10(H)]